MISTQLLIAEYFCYRNSDKSARPQFREIVKTLSQPEHELLHIPEEVSKGHPQASILGAPLEAGSNLYTELQNTYMQWLVYFRIISGFLFVHLLVNACVIL